LSNVILDRITANPRLPSLPAVAVKVLELTERPEASVHELASVIEKDQALATRLIKTVNSALYGLKKPCSTINQAIVALGLSAVRTLALGFSLVTNLRSAAGEGFDHVDYWRRGLYTAVAAKLAAESSRQRNADEAFLGGLLQDIGMMALYQTLGRNYVKTIALTNGDHSTLAAHERDLLGLTHCEAGARLAEIWKLPPQLHSAIAFHETPEVAPPEYAELVRCVALGNKATQAMIAPDPRDHIAMFAVCARQWLALNGEQIDHLFQRIAQGTQEMAGMLELSRTDLPSVEEILARKDELLIQLSLTQNKTVSELEEQRLKLLEKANRDALTGLCNRRWLDTSLSQLFTRSRTTAEPLSVLFIDADRFKLINDRLGHLAGDAVLIQIARRLSNRAAEIGASVFRWGGEEFCVLLPGFDRVAAAAEGEFVRAMIAGEPFDLTGTGAAVAKLHTTVSVGTATLHAASALDTPEKLVQAADSAMYAAKQSGRNCVRVFSEQSRTAAA